MRFDVHFGSGIGDRPPRSGTGQSTVIRLKDSETNLLAGLIRRDERKSLRAFPA
jgi:hypothetical protein